MATYIILSTLTDEGRRTLKDRPERLEEVNHELEAMGGRVSLQYALLGRYDFITVVEAPDNAAITKITAELGTRGTIRLTTVPAFPVEPSTRRTRRLFGRERPNTYVVFTRLTPAGRGALRGEAERLTGLEVAAQRLGAEIVRQYRVLGEHDFITVVEAPDNAAAARIAAEVSSLGSVKLNVYPAIILERFMELLRLRAYRTEPHRWQTQPWASALRAAGRYWVMTRHVRDFCRPLTVEGAERLKGFKGPALIIANHSSHFDTPAALTVLPGPLRAKTTVAAAADRFYRTDRQTWWYSLFWNTFPIQRGGGKAALDYPMSLLSRGWSVLIYPEGGRFKAGEVQRFHHGVTILAKVANVPVVPIYMDGLADIMPKGARNPRPGPVRARLGAPVSLEGVDDVPEGTALLERAMRELADLPPREA